MSGSAPAQSASLKAAASPSVTGPSVFDYLPKPSSTLSDADIAAGAPLRESARTEVLTEQTYSNKLVPVLTKAGVSSFTISSSAR